MLVFSLRRRSTIGIGEITEWLRYTESKGCPLHDLEEKYMMNGQNGQHVNTPI